MGKLANLAAAKSDEAPSHPFDVPEDDQDVDQTSSLLNPKRAIAKAALRHLVPTKSLRAIQRGEPIVVLLETPNVGWTSALALAASDLLPTSRIITAVRAPGRQEPAEAPTISRPTFAITSDPGWLAPALVTAADIRLRVSLTPAIVETALKLATGRKARVGPQTIVGLDILDVAAAIRTGESATKAVRRMQEAVRSRSAGFTDDAVPQLASLVGYGPALVVVRSIADDVVRVVAGDIEASALPSMLFFGEPGSGKTMLARSFAKTVGLPLIPTSVADWFSSSNGNLGDVVVAAQRAFDRAVASSPSVLFLDEIDALPDRGTMDNRARDWWLPVITGVLMMIDRVRARGSGVVLIAATNYRDKLDAALRRPGRFDRHIKIAPPATVGELAGVLRHHLKQALADADLSAVARLGLGATGAQAEDRVRQAQESARRDGREMTVHDLASAIAPPDTRTERERQEVAIHEAGHALVGRALGQKIVSVSILASEKSEGSTTFETPKAVFTRDELERQVVIGLGGRAADELLSGAPTSGAAGDLRKVTQLIAAAHASLSLGTTLASCAPFDRAGDLVALDPVLRRIVEDDLSRLMETARDLVRSHRPEIEALADWLVIHRIATCAEVEALLIGASCVLENSHGMQG